MTYKQISPAQAKDLMESRDDIVILDVRTQEEYASVHIKDSICLPNEEISAVPEELPDKAQTILVYCRSGVRSKEAAEKLAGLGYQHILEFGGIINWPYEELTARGNQHKI